MRRCCNLPLALSQRGNLENFCSWFPPSFFTPTVQDYSGSKYFGSRNDVLPIIPCHFQAVFTSHQDMRQPSNFRAIVDKAGNREPVAAVS